MVLTFAKPRPPLGESTTIVRVDATLAWLLALGVATLKKQP